MKPKDLNIAKNPDLIGSVAAIKRAALMARQVAIQTNTAIIVSENGQMVRKTARDLS